MKHLVQEFISSKSLSPNSQKSYAYDLQQFLEIVSSQISQPKLKLYEQSLANLKVSAKKRKISAVNQFLYFLYERGEVKQFYKIKNTEKVTIAHRSNDCLDLTAIYRLPVNSVGQLIALLIVELGLSPNELIQLKQEHIDRSFQVLTIYKNQSMRVLKLTNPVLEVLQDKTAGVYLFDNHGSTYSRQWFFNHLNDFLKTIGLSQLTAQKLREQYILHQKQAGISSQELSRKLGLKSPLTLEKYYKD